MIRQVDYIIIGHGLAGSVLAWELLRRDKSILVFDTPEDNRASAVAAGIFNPVTGRVMTKTWKADDIFPFLEKFYTEAEEVLHAKFFNKLPIYRPFVSEEEKQQWKQKGETQTWEWFKLMFRDVPDFDREVFNPFGGLEITKAGYLNVVSWLDAVRDYLKSRDLYRQEYFLEQELLVNERVKYRDVEAKKIIFCNGLRTLDTKWFGWLPLKPLKGETLEVRIEADLERIYNRSVYVVPATERGVYKIGATYQHPPFPEAPSLTAREELESGLSALVKCRYEVIHQDWGIRPSTPDRRPFLGAHPGNKNVIIFNGLGTKGVSLSPYFAQHLGDYLEGNGDLLPEVNIYRFKALYSG